ncbi:MAG TPA: hypothetical protein VGE63_03225 [Candidatus Paceibacterota bacterium]
MLIKQVFIVTECNTTKAEDLWYQDVARHLQAIFDIKSFLIDLTQVKTEDDLKKQQQEFELITRSMRDPFLIISHGIGSRMVTQSQILTRMPHIMVAPYLYHSSNHEYEAIAQPFNFLPFGWPELEKFTDTFLIELGGDTLIDKISHKEAGTLRQLHFHYVPYDGHGAITGSHNEQIPDITAEVMRIMVQRGYALENEKFLQFKKELTVHPLHITPAIEIETLSRELALATSETSPAAISALLREAREKEAFYAKVTHARKDKFDKQIAILVLIFGIFALIIILLNDTISFTAPKPVTTQTGIYIQTPYIKNVLASNDTVLFETSKNSQEIFNRKTYLIDKGISEAILVTSGFEDVYLIEAPKSPRTILFEINDTTAYLSQQDDLMRAFLRVPMTEKLDVEFNLEQQLYSITYKDITLYSTCVSGTICGMSTNKDLLLKMKSEIFSSDTIKK